MDGGYDSKIDSHVDLDFSIFRITHPFSQLQSRASIIGNDSFQLSIIFDSSERRVSSAITIELLAILLINWGSAGSRAIGPVVAGGPSTTSKSIGGRSSGIAVSAYHGVAVLADSKGA